MKNFAQLYRQLDQTNAVTKKVLLLKRYFESVSDEEKLWLIALFSGRRIRGVITVSRLREYAMECSGISQWLFEECYSAVGDLAETIALVLPAPAAENGIGLDEAMDLLQRMAKMEEEQKKSVLLEMWNTLDTFERFIFNKLLTGGFRVGVSQKLVCKALSHHTGLDENTVVHRLMGNWSPFSTTYQQLLFSEHPEEHAGRPYPFCLAQPLGQPLEELGDVNAWMAEYKWDGIRGQLIRRDGMVFIWSRGEELVTNRFPELVTMGAALPDGTVLDGEILAMQDGRPLPFTQLQTRINRKAPGKKLLQEVPVVFVAYDLLEHAGKDLRTAPLSQRRSLLEQLIRTAGLPALLCSTQLEVNSWDGLLRLRQEAVLNGTEGLMIKRLDSVYETGRKTGAWWKWKADPFTIDAVMIYAQTGHGRRAGMFTDYTFALWQGDRLVPVAKAYSGLTDAEIRQVDDFVKKNTKEKFGPVRSVQPVLVFELGFEAVNQSARHKSGVAVRFPRILRWRTDKPAAEANTLDDLKKLIR